MECLFCHISIGDQIPNPNVQFLGLLCVSVAIWRRGNFDGFFFEIATLEKKLANRLVICNFYLLVFTISNENEQMFADRIMRKTLQDL